MSSIFIQVEDPEALCSCSDCEWEGPAKDLQMVSSIEERISAGEIVPAGECPACGALAHLTAQPIYVIGVEGGVVQGMSTNTLSGAMPRIIVCDWDTQGDDGVEIGDGRANVYEPHALLDEAFIKSVVDAIDAGEEE
ncbi:MAG TPA: hypothetical protein VMI56_17160 [Reyranella sp.]|nr:hypothetical protein [Reyranella sp.]